MKSFAHREFLPHEQYRFDGLKALEPDILNERRQIVFIILCALFLGALSMINIFGLTRFIDLSFRIPGTHLVAPMPLAVGVLPYPVTFLCTDLVSEFYGRRRATQMVWAGLALNLWIMSVFWLGGVMPGLKVPGSSENGQLFFSLRELVFSSVVASMIAYLTAQSVDVYLFHFWKKITKGRHLWLRNNGSTLVSQLVDTVAVILIVHYLAHALPIDKSRSIGLQLLVFILASYMFKLVAALCDTLPFYVGVSKLSRYLRIHPIYGIKRGGLRD